MGSRLLCLPSCDKFGKLFLRKRLQLRDPEPSIAPTRPRHPRHGQAAQQAASSQAATGGRQQQPTASSQQAAAAATAANSQSVSLEAQVARKVQSSLSQNQGQQGRRPPADSPQAASAHARCLVP